MKDTSYFTFDNEVDFLLLTNSIGAGDFQEFQLEVY